MKSIPCPLEQAAHHHPNSVFIIEKNNILSCDEGLRRVLKEEDELKKRGIKKGSRAGLVSVNNSDYIITLLALWRLGAVACLFSSRLPSEQVRKHIKFLHARLIETRDSGLGTRTRNEERGTSPSKYFINQPATIIFTSGTSAEPKAAVHSFGNHYYSALGSNIHIPVRPGDRWLINLPLYHVGGLSIIFRTLLGKGTMVLADAGRSLAMNLKDYKITHVSLVPTQLSRLLESRHTRFPRLKAVLVGGSPIPEALIKKSIQRQIPLYISYGLTEMSSQVATSGLIRRPTDAKNIRVLKYRRLKISKTGEILVKGETLFKGYVQGNKFYRPFDKNGWFATGDLGKLHPCTLHTVHCKPRRSQRCTVNSVQFTLKVTGRKDNMFISGGENIQPEEIEKYLGRIAGIEEAVVVPRPDKEFGHRPVAFIKRFKGSNLAGRRIAAQLSRHLPKFKIPVAFHPWPKMKEGMKIDRRALSQLIQ